jgi:hypothetical protein
VTDRRGECDDPAAASGLLHTLRAGRLDAPMLAPAEPRWAQLRFAVAPAVSKNEKGTGHLLAANCLIYWMGDSNSWWLVRWEETS